MTGSFRTLKAVTRRTLSAPCLWLFHEPGLWFQCSFSKAVTTAPSSDSSRWLTVTSLFWLLIKIPEATLHCVQIREAIADSFVSLDSILRAGWSFPCRTLTEWAITSGVCLKHLLQFEKSIFLSALKTIPLPSKVSDGLPVTWWGWGESKEKNFNLLQKPSKALPNWKTNSNYITSLFPEEMLLMNKTMRKCRFGVWSRQKWGQTLNAD